MVDGRADRRVGDLPVEVGAEHERDLSLDPRLQEAARCDGAVVVDGHVVEQHPEVRGVDAELGLHGGVRQPDLAPDDPGPRVGAVRGQAALHGVRDVDVVGADEVAERGARRSCGGGVEQTVGGLLHTRGEWGRGSRG